MTKDEIIYLMKWSHSYGLEQGLAVDSSKSDGEFSMKWFEDMFDGIATETVTKRVKEINAYNYQMSKIRKGK